MDIKLNAVDYKIWGITQDRVYARKITSVDETQAEHLWLMGREYTEIDQQLIDSAIKQWCKRLAACVSARGGHIEHTL